MTSPRVAAILGVLALVALLGGLPLAAFADQFTYSGAGIFAAVAPFALVGFVLARRVPGNPIGWILLGLALIGTGSTDAGFYAFRAFELGDRALPLARVAVFLAAGWLWLILLMPLPIALFPDGRLPRRWRWTLPTYLSACVLLLVVLTWEDVSGVLARHLRIDATGELAIFGDSPNHTLKIAEGLFLPVYTGFFVAWVLRLIIGYRRASGVERQQLKWLFSGAAICIVALVVGITASTSVVGNVAWAAIAALPIGMAVGILRYRLYDIDRLISRTLSYALLTGLLAGVFVGIVVLATDVLPFSSPVGVAASTLAAAALFNPLRIRLQRIVDRRFNRSRYDAEAIVGAFSARLREAVDLDNVRSELVAAVEQAVQPAHASVWIRSALSEARR